MPTARSLKKQEGLPALPGAPKKPFLRLARSGFGLTLHKKIAIQVLASL